MRMGAAMAKGVLDRLNSAAKKRLKELRIAAERAADGLLQKSYVGTAEQTLRGAEAVTKILHEEGRDIAKAQKSVAREPAARRSTAGKPKRKSSKGRKASTRKATKPKAR
jgi:hypothetical protein